MSQSLLCDLNSVLPCGVLVHTWAPVPWETGGHAGTPRVTWILWSTPMDLADFQLCLWLTAIWLPSPSGPLGSGLPLPFIYTLHFIYLLWSWLLWPISQWNWWRLLTPGPPPQSLSSRSDCSVWPKHHPLLPSLLSRASQLLLLPLRYSCFLPPLWLTSKARFSSLFFLKHPSRWAHSAACSGAAF